MAYKLITPVVREAPAGGGPLFMRYSLLRGVTLLVSPDGGVAAVRYPSEEQLAAAAVAYIGGHEYWITDEAGQVLIDAGFGDSLVHSDGYVNHYEPGY